MELTVAVLTYKRPDDIAALLPMLHDQIVAVASPQLVARVLVVDNDAAGSARDFVAAFAVEVGDSTIEYALEATPGISAARNRALAESASSDLLVFIDDDERPSERWLTHLLDARTRFNASAVAGPVISQYSVQPSAWIVAGRFFDRRRMSTGTTLEVAATNNLLLDLNRVRELGLTFDMSAGLTGGEDTLFTRELHQTSKLVWSDEAIVTDVVPPHRLTRAWVLQRALSSGNSWSVTELKLTPSGIPRLRKRGVLTAKAGVRMLGGIARLTIGVLTRSLGNRARGRRTLARGWGMFLGAWGYSHAEYKRPTSPDS